MRRLARHTALGMLLLALVLGVAASAEAHAVLLEAEPADGSVLARAPAEIVLRFNATVTPVFVRVLDSTGHTVSVAGNATATDQSVHLQLPATLPNGTYIVSYRVISADSHPVGESVAVVALLVIAGVVMATQQLARPLDLLDTPYGRRLGMKLVLVIALLLKRSLANAALGIEPSEHAATPDGPGVFEIADLPIPASGTWTISIAALVSDFDRRIVTTEVPIR